MKECSMVESSDQNSGAFELSKNDATGIAIICINNPTKRNAINGQMMEQLAHVITELEEWKTGKAVIIYGKNGFFSSGVDLNTVRKNMNTREAGYRYSRLMHSNLSRLKSLSLLTIAVVQGKALGGGAEILTACDLRLMTQDAEIGFVHICVGVTPGWSGGTRLVRILGYTKALEILMSGRLIKADEAMRIGFASHIFDEFETTNSLLGKTNEWLAQYINDSDLIKYIKEALSTDKF